MSKSYLRYSSIQRPFGIIVSQSSNIVTNDKRHLCVCGASQSVAIWNLNTEERSVFETTSSSEVTRVQSKGNMVCAGFADGRLVVWDIETKKIIFEGKGHKHAITALTHGDESVIASGGKDTDIVVWDTIRGAGEFRLRGHNDEVTDLVFFAKSNSENKYLASSSKDTLFKVWCMETQCCVQTCVGHRSEVWSIAKHPSMPYLMTASSDRFVRMWKIQEEETVSDKNEHLKLVGTLQRQAGGRSSEIRFNETGTHLACQSNSKGTDLWYMRSEKNAFKKAKRRERRSREKDRKKEVRKKDADDEKTEKKIEVLGGEDDDDFQSSETEQKHSQQQQQRAEKGSLIPSDWFESVTVVRTPVKVKSFAFAQGTFSAPKVTKTKTRKYVGIVFALQNNSLGLYRCRLRLPSKEISVDKIYLNRKNITLQGHRAGIRAVAMSHDNQLVVTTSAHTTKVWRASATSFECIRTIETGFGLCVAFVSGDRHVILGTKTGSIQLLSLASSEVMETLDNAHDGSVWSIAMRPDRTGFVSAGADKTVHFYEFDVTNASSENSQQQQQRLTFVHTRTLKMSDEVLSVRYSHAPGRPEKLLLAVALLDSTVKIFYDDTLKFHLSLYGHKLPVLSLDISSDDTLLVSASSDKDVKLWGLDFGDCHKSIFAHGDAVTCVRFVRNTHYFFSCGKDGLVKYWDGDTYDMILELRGHTSEVWSLCISNDGEFVVSASNDRSIRMWQRTMDQVFLEEEREDQMERMFFEEAVDRHAKSRDAQMKEKGEMLESQIAGKKSIESVKSAERLIEGIELVLHERERESAVVFSKNKKKNPLLLGMSPLKYALRVLRSIQSSEMEQALLVLPFHLVEKLLEILRDLIRESLDPELTARVVIFLLRLHHGAITASRALRPVLRELCVDVQKNLSSNRDRIGFNIAGLKMIKRNAEEDALESKFVSEIPAAKRRRLDDLEQ